MEIAAEVLRDIEMLFAERMFLWNVVFAVFIVFFQRRDPRGVWAWLLLLYFIPVLGFVFYLLFGQDMRKRKMFRMKELEDQLNVAIRRQEHRLKAMRIEDLDAEIQEYKDLILYNLDTAGAMLSADNDIDIFRTGSEKFEALLEDLKKAEHFINIQYYIIRNDELFGRIREVLRKKAAEGVEVRVLFDAMGCRAVSRNMWKELRGEGILVAEFFPAILGRLQLRINYRNHRKIVVIDNKVAYVGGFNVGREYLGLHKKFGHWRDTHLRIAGGAVVSLQMRFIMDWNYAAGENLLQNPRMFVEAASGKSENCKMQIISSGPDHTAQPVRDNYLRLIAGARHSIYIQTPYFIPDESIFNALLLAARSGISINIMIPCKPDHLFVYWATYSYVGDMVAAGANCYTYNDGFLHSKGLVVDGEVLCYGTANMDIRSFALNFEVNATVYDRKKALEMESCFKEDLKVCRQITVEFYAGRGILVRVKEQICRLLSPLL